MSGNSRKREGEEIRRQGGDTLEGWRGRGMGKKRGGMC